MTHHLPKARGQQAQQRCTICAVFQSMGRGQYRSSYDREMYLHHLQIAHGAKLSDAQAGIGSQSGSVVKE